MGQFKYKRPLSLSKVVAMLRLKLHIAETRAKQRKGIEGHIWKKSAADRETILQLIVDLRDDEIKRNEHFTL
jgi:hypothetical protein